MTVQRQWQTILKNHNYNHIAIKMILFLWTQRMTCCTNNVASSRQTCLKNHNSNLITIKVILCPGTPITTGCMNNDAASMTNNPKEPPLNLITMLSYAYLSCISTYCSCSHSKTKFGFIPSTWVKLLKNHCCNLIAMKVIRCLRHHVTTVSSPSKEEMEATQFHRRDLLCLSWIAFCFEIRTKRYTNQEGSSVKQLSFPS